ncbi:MAG TPA: hypothetical protein VNJ01_01265 [Bacteriovoracaceae bacterium]|nr:hypothetical protein [Bacteriovoracaceae bacterium]
MELDKAIELLRKAVKYTGVIDQKHIDLTLVPVAERAEYEKALVISQTAIKEGKISREEFLKQVNLD